MILLCFGAPIFGVDPYGMNPAALYEGPSAAHWLGTDDAGRDFLARLLYGGRISITVGVVTALLILLIGGTLGLVAGYFGGPLDAAVMRATELATAVPKLPLMLLLAAVDFGRFLPGREIGSIATVVVVVSLFGWATAARLARGAALHARNLEFVTAARALGLDDLAIIRRHILPEAAAPLIVATTLTLGDVILYESVLSFLGLGVRPPVPSWGAMLSRGLVDLIRAPYLIILPGLLTGAVVAAFHLVGDGFRDALDPR